MLFFQVASFVHLNLNIFHLGGKHIMVTQEILTLQTCNFQIQHSDKNAQSQIHNKFTLNIKFAGNKRQFIKK